MLRCRALIKCGQPLVTRTTCFPRRTTNCYELPVETLPKWPRSQTNSLLRSSAMGIGAEAFPRFVRFVKNEGWRPSR